MPENKSKNLIEDGEKIMTKKSTIFRGIFKTEKLVTVIWVGTAHQAQLAEKGFIRILRTLSLEKKWTIRFSSLRSVSPIKEEPRHVHKSFVPWIRPSWL